MSQEETKGQKKSRSQISYPSIILAGRKETDEKWKKEGGKESESLREQS